MYIKWRRKFNNIANKEMKKYVKLQPNLDQVLELLDRTDWVILFNLQKLQLGSDGSNGCNANGPDLPFVSSSYLMRSKCVDIVLSSIARVTALDAYMEMTDMVMPKDKREILDLRLEDYGHILSDIFDRSDFSFSWLL